MEESEILEKANSNTKNSYPFAPNDWNDGAAGGRFFKKLVLNRKVDIGLKVFTSSGSSFEILYILKNEKRPTEDLTIIVGIKGNIHASCYYGSVNGFFPSIWEEISKDEWIEWKNQRRIIQELLY